MIFGGGDDALAVPAECRRVNFIGVSFEEAPFEFFVVAGL
jgi:hypothetical protein